MYVFCLFMRVLLSWFPGIDWNAQPWTFLRLVRVLTTDRAAHSVTTARSVTTAAATQQQQVKQ
jgi:hypothetical protein